MEIWFNQMEFHPIPWVHLREVTFRDQSSTSGRVMVDGCGWYPIWGTLDPSHDTSMCSICSNRWCMMVPYAIAVSRKKCCFPLEKCWCHGYFNLLILYLWSTKGVISLGTKYVGFPVSLAMFLKCLSLALVRQMTRL